MKSRELFYQTLIGSVMGIFSDVAQTIANGIAGIFRSKRTRTLSARDEVEYSRKGKFYAFLCILSTILVTYVFVHVHVNVKQYEY